MDELPPERHLDIFLRAHRTVGLRLRQKFAEAEAVSPIEASLLVLLMRSADRRKRIEELSHQLGLTKSAVSRLVDRLEREGYVQRVMSTQDRRAVYAVMTSNGQNALRHVTRVFRSVFEEVFLGGLTPDELNQMTALLLRLSEANQPARAAAAQAADEVLIPEA